MYAKPRVIARAEQLLACLHNLILSRNSSLRFSPPPPELTNPMPLVAMSTCSTRRSAASLLSSSPRCVHLGAAVPRLLTPLQRRCLHQESETQQPESASLKYRPIRQRFVAPFPVKPQKPFAVNHDPRRLEAMYQKLLGGDLGLSEEVKWQAVTHKSFDHGWQAFNEKLAFFGE